MPQRECLWSVVYVAAGENVRQAVGILLLDKAADAIHAKLKADWRATNEDDQLWWDEFRNDLLGQSAGAGGSFFFEMLQESASHFLTVSDARETDCRDISSLLEKLYAEHVSE
jgi:hypothetical protein